MAVKVFPSDQQAATDVWVHLRVRLHSRGRRQAPPAADGRTNAVRGRGRGRCNPSHPATSPPHDNMSAGIKFAVMAVILRADGGFDLQVPSALSHISKVTPRVLFPLVLSDRLSKAMVG